MIKPCEEESSELIWKIFVPLPILSPTVMEVRSEVGEVFERLDDGLFAAS